LLSLGLQSILFPFAVDEYKDLTIENYYFPAVLYGCESCSLTLRRTFENRMLREIFGPTRQEEAED
jgi:hypothetical protein